MKFRRPRGWVEWAVMTFAATLLVLQVVLASILIYAVINGYPICPAGKQLTSLAGGKLGLVCQ